MGAYAVIHYTQPRYTKDLNLWLRPSVENSIRVARVFRRFGVPLIEVTQEDFSREGLQYASGRPSCQIDFLTSLPGVPDFEAARINRVTETDEGIAIEFLGRVELVSSKQTANRPQDLADLDELRRAAEI